jgi:hypothetical protein
MPHCRVRIISLDDPTIYDDSNADFRIEGDLDLIAPKKSQVLRVNSREKILWARNGRIESVRIEYSTDSGKTYPHTIATKAKASLLSYDWKVPDSISDQVQVKITNIDNPLVSAQSQDFSIKGSLRLTAPLGIETFYVGDTMDIVWQKQGSIGDVVLEYSTQGFINKSKTATIAKVSADKLKYTWVVSDSISDEVSIRIYQAKDALVSDILNQTFSIKGKLKLISPNGGESYRVENQEDIVWNATGSVTNISLKYSSDAGATFNTIISSYLASKGVHSYAWRLPDDISQNCLVKVLDADDAQVFDISDDVFSIRGIIEVVSPKEGQRLSVGSSEKIEWNVLGTELTDIEIRYSTDGGQTYPYVITPKAESRPGFFIWQDIPDSIGDLTRIKLIDVGDPEVSAQSQAFSIIGSLDIVSPASGVNFDVSKVKLYYSTNNKDYTYITTVQGKALSYSWSVPDEVASQATIKITDALREEEVFDISDKFNISGTFNIVSPSQGKVLVVGSSYPIKWKKKGSAVENVDLIYSWDGGNRWQAITRGIANSGRYIWQVPDSISANCKIKIFDSNNVLASNSSPGFFKIRGSLKITSPNGKEVWTVGRKRNITWDAKGSLGYVRLELSTDGASSYPYLIAESVKASLGKFSWVVPDTISKQVKVRMVTISDSTVYDESDGTFGIRGALSIKAPNGGEILKVGSLENITWKRTGSIQQVKLAYSTDSGRTYPNIITTSHEASTEEFLWQVPDEIGGSLRVKITDVSDATVYDASSRNFTIKGVLSLTFPFGDEVFYVQDREIITWESAGSISEVKLEYSTNSGVSFDNLIATSVKASLGSFVWQIPDDVSEKVKVKVTDVSDDKVYATSSENLSIKPRLKLISPFGGEQWVVGSTQTIRWGSIGTVGKVRLEYSKDQGNTYPHLIADSLDFKEASYDWGVPDNIGDSLKVRVISLSDSEVFDSSKGVFKIKGKLKLTSPNGKEEWVVASKQPIAWTKIGSIDRVSLSYSTDGGKTYPNMVVRNVSSPRGNFTWVIPDSISNNCRVKITDDLDQSVFDSSDSDFKIKGTLTLISPNGGQSWPVASTQYITWKMIGSISDVRLDYSINGGETFDKAITSATLANTLQFGWQVPDDVTLRARVRISDVNDSTVRDSSDLNFAIGGKFDITSPQGGEVWTVGSEHNITWKTLGEVEKVHLEYSTDNARTFTIISKAVPNRGSFVWTIPDAISSKVRVKVSDVSNPVSSAISEDSFKIRGAIAVTSPLGGEVWTTGSHEKINWQASGGIKKVKIEYSTDSGLSYPNIIVSSVDARRESFSWLVPSVSSSLCRIKVSDARDSTVYGYSKSNFKIRGDLLLTRPKPNQTFIVGSIAQVEWDVIGKVDKVKLYYSTNRGRTFNSLIAEGIKASQNL